MEEQGENLHLLVWVLISLLQMEQEEVSLIPHPQQLVIWAVRGDWLHEIMLEVEVVEQLVMQEMVEGAVMETLMRNILVLLMFLLVVVEQEQEEALQLLIVLEGAESGFLVIQELLQAQLQEALQEETEHLVGSEDLMEEEEDLMTTIQIDLEVLALKEV